MSAVVEAFRNVIGAVNSETLIIRALQQALHEQFFQEHSVGMAWSRLVSEVQLLRAE